MRAGQFVVFDLGGGPQAFLDRFAGRRQFRGRRASDQDAFDDRSVFLCGGYHNLIRAEKRYSLIDIGCET